MNYSGHMVNYYSFSYTSLQIIFTAFNNSVLVEMSRMVGTFLSQFAFTEVVVSVGNVIAPFLLNWKAYLVVQSCATYFWICFELLFEGTFPNYPFLHFYYVPCPIKLYLVAIGWDTPSFVDPVMPSVLSILFVPFTKALGWGLPINLLWIMCSSIAKFDNYDNIWQHELLILLIEHSFFIWI